MNQNLFDEIIKNMQEEKLNMESLIITQNDTEYKYLFKKEKIGNIYSISKTMTSVALGIAISKGYFKDGIYYHDGSAGQYMIIVPDRNIVITTTGNQKDMKSITDCMGKQKEGI